MMKHFLLLLSAAVAGLASQGPDTRTTHITRDFLLTTSVMRGYALKGNGTNDMQWTVEAKNVRDWGAVGDWDHNDTTNIQQAIDLGGAVYIPEGYYMVDTLVITNTCTVLFGDGRSSVLIARGAQPILVCKAINGMVEVRDLAFNGRYQATHGIDIWPDGGKRSIFENLFVWACDYGIKMGTNYNYSMQFRGCEITSNTNGLWLGGTCANTLIEDCRIFSNKSSNLTIDKQPSGLVAGVWIFGCDIENDLGAGYDNITNIYANGVQPLIIHGWFSEPSGNGSRTNCWDLVSVDSQVSVEGWYANGAAVGGNSSQSIWLGTNTDLTVSRASLINYTTNDVIFGKTNANSLRLEDYRINGKLLNESYQAGELVTGYYTNYSAVLSGKHNRAQYGNYSGVGSGIDNSADGSFGFIAGGHNGLIASGVHSAFIGGGFANWISAHYGAILGGKYGKARLYGEQGHASGKFAEVADAQRSELVARRSIQVNGVAAGPGPGITNDWNAVFLDGDDCANRMVLPWTASTQTNALWTFSIQVSALSTTNYAGTYALNTGSYEIDGAIKRVENAVTLLTSTVTTMYEDNAAWDVRVAADAANRALQIDFYPEADCPLVVATVRLTQVTKGR